MNRGRAGGLQAKIKEHKELVAQLQRELDVNRIKVSEAVADIHKYVLEHQDSDPLASKKGGGGSSGSLCSCIFGGENS